MDRKDRYNYSIILEARMDITFGNMGRNGNWIGAKLSS